MAEPTVITRYEDLTIGSQVSLAGAKYLVELDTQSQKYFQGPGQDTDIESLAVQSFFQQGGQVEQLKDAAPDPKVWSPGDHVLDADSELFIYHGYPDNTFQWVRVNDAPRVPDKKMRRPLVHVATTEPVI